MKPKEFDNLVKEFDSKFSELSNIEYEGLETKRIELKQKFDEFRNSGEQLLSDNDTLEIGIVGQMKAGKSSFLNAMLFDGEEILPEAPTPMTAGLTVIEYSEDNYFEAEFFSNEDWNELKRLDEAYSNMERQIREGMTGQSEEDIKKQLDTAINVECKSAHEVIGRLSAKAKKKREGGGIDKIPFEHISELRGILNNYVGASGEYTSVVKCTRILLNDNRIQGLKIVDTPGINDPIVSREQRTNMELGSCHGVFFLSRADQFMVQQDVDFMTKMINSKGVARLVILASMFDVAMCTSPERGTFDYIYQRELNQRRNTHSETLKRIGDEELKEKARLDIVCGMGASIIYKLRNGIQLSNFEDKVVQNMKQYFPNDFTNNDNIIANLAKIANIEELDDLHLGIRKNHLEGTFLRNKDRIIGEKIQNFFEGSSYDIVECIERLIKDYTREKNIVENTSLSDLNAKGNAQSILFDKIEGSIGNILNRFIRDVQARINEVNTMDFPDVTIPTSYQYRTFDYLGSERCGFLWLSKKDVVLSKSFYYTGIDTSRLRSKVNEAFETCAKKFSQGWKEAITKSINELPKAITDKIFELAANDQAATFDQDFYLNLFEHTLDDIRVFSDLDLKQVVDDWERNVLNDYCQQYIPSGYGFDKLREDEVTKELNNYSNTYINNLATNIRTEGRNGITKLKNKATNQLDSLKDEVDKLKENIKDRMTADVKAYLEQLQNRIQDKTNSIENIDKIITNLGDLKHLFTQVREQNSNIGTRNIRRRR